MLPSDRVLKLEVIDGKKPRTSTGLVDTRLFNNGGSLHAVMDNQTCLWTFKYDSGTLPPKMKQQFTSFSALKKFADQYFETRNLKIVEVNDAAAD